MSTKSFDPAKDAELHRIAEAMRKVKSKTQRRILEAQLDAILGIEGSPSVEDTELLEAWEKSRK